MGQITSSSDVGQSLEVRLHTGGSRAKNRMNQPHGAFIPLGTQRFYFQPSTLFIPFFIIHPLLLAALYPAEQQEV